ncbi:unnamed protein product [Mytilus edulis]|uniref:Uncharacterized protein n=1 Tax=Mytilus edulis TaxID=6550 RepID=A0A8S3U495_MYTED|nr:unnamed protein product [Mytilus edulis]
MGSATSKSKQHKSGETRLSNHLSTDITEHKSDDATNTTDECTVFDDADEIIVINCNSNLELYNIASKPITLTAREVSVQGLKGHPENETDVEAERLSSHSQFSNAVDIQEDGSEISNVEGIANIPPFSTTMTRDQCTADGQTQNNVITDSENDMLQNDVISLEDQRTESNDLNGISNKKTKKKNMF